MMSEMANQLYLAYVGPGAGLTMLGALLAVACVLLLAVLSPLFYLFQIVRWWLRSRPRKRGSHV